MSTVAEALQMAVRYQTDNLDLERAKSIYQKILAILPENTDALYGLSMVARQKGEYSTAENLLRSLLQKQPSSFKVWFSLGNVYQIQGHLPEAVAAYQQALKLQPKAFVIYNNLGHVLELQGKVDEALESYQTALDLQPNCAEAEVNLANLLHRQGRLSQDRQAYYAAKNNNLGVARKVAGDYPTAIAYFQQAIALQPELVLAYYNLGSIFQEREKMEEAIACYQKVPEVATSNTGIYHQLVRNKLNRINRGLKHNQEKQSGQRLKIAFVNQYCDTILPPRQNSIGACTYGIARPLAECCNVIVYGLKDSEIDDDYDRQGVHYRFLSRSRLDLWLYEQFQKYGKYGKLFNRGMTPPPSTSNWVFPLYGRQVARDLLQQQCDIICFQHTTQYIPIVRALNPQAKIILNLHHERYPQSKRSMLEKRLRYVDAITCVSDYVTQKTRQDFPHLANRCQTVYNGIDASEFAREKDYSKARQKKIKRIMYAGAVSPEKGVHILLDAFQTVVRDYSEVQLVIVGPQAVRPLEEVFPQTTSQKNDSDSIFLSLKPFYSQSYLALLKEKLTSDIAEKVSILGMIPRSQLVDCFFDADIFVFPSLWDEGFGLPAVEAMAAGTPVVATRSGALVETIREGKTGFLVEKNHVFALATAILRLLENDDLRESMSKAARQWALENFTWDRTADSMLQLGHFLTTPDSNDK